MSTVEAIASPAVPPSRTGTRSRMFSWALAEGLTCGPTGRTGRRIPRTYAVWCVRASVPSPEELAHADAGCCRDDAQDEGGRCVPDAGGSALGEPEPHGLDGGGAEGREAAAEARADHRLESGTARVGRGQGEETGQQAEQERSRDVDDESAERDPEAAAAGHGGVGDEARDGSGAAREGDEQRRHRRAPGSGV